MTARVVLGVDPGLRGGLAVLGRPHPAACPIPTSGSGERRGGTRYDYDALARWIEAAGPAVAFVEKVGARPKQGSVGTFTFGTGYGAILGILAAYRVTTWLVTPQTWKKWVLAGTAKDKDAAVAFCRRQYPGLPLVLPRCRVPHDGMADALCIAHYGLTYHHTSRGR